MSPSESYWDFIFYRTPKITLFSGFLDKVTYNIGTYGFTRFSYLLATEHNVRGPLEAVNDGLPARVEVIEPRLDDRVVDVHGWGQELSGLGHLVQPMDSSDGLFDDTLEI